MRVEENERDLHPTGQKVNELQDEIRVPDINIVTVKTL
jgi:hypothetical protein